jgi:hypothetical protein
MIATIAKMATIPITIAHNSRPFGRVTIDKRITATAHAVTSDRSLCESTASSLPLGIQ